MVAVIFKFVGERYEFSLDAAFERRANLIVGVGINWFRIDEKKIPLLQIAVDVTHDYFKEGDYDCQRIKLHFTVVELMDWDDDRR